MGQQLAAPLGADVDWQITAQDSSSTAVVFDGTETLAATCWPGEGLPATFVPSASFLVPSAGTILLSVAAAQTAPLEAGLYRLQVTVSTGGRTFVVFDGGLQLTSAPGSQSVLPVYCSYQDMIDILPWIGRLQSQDGDTEGFTKERGEAREWIDGIILDSYPARTGYGFGFDQRSYVQSWSAGSLVPDRWLVDQLAAGALLTTGPIGRPIARAAATFACAQACKRQLGQGGRATEWEVRGRKLEAEAFVKITQCTAQLDITGDGRPDLAIPLRITNTRYA
jgi:hypothetical protein